ncbi:N(6)-adenine-specific methyltransferase METTL4 [Chrysoperla carnea]|uniref:N(6)-adenine-specific methyltransferase METTL4 n=1 Tax=Chrysoperla carnea TaxID=189513 RepID=UPI001D07A213|nr:N(6)-adenine-specific methyltransferase METTL4 [Chrysoperla carnea]
MSILFENEYGWILSHSEYIKNVYKQTKYYDTIIDYEYKDKLFEINTAYLRTNQKPNGSVKVRKRNHATLTENQTSIENDIRDVQNLYNLISKDANIFEKSTTDIANEDALKTAQECYTLSAGDHFLNMVAGNDSLSPIKMNRHDKNYIFPPKTLFYCKDVKEMLHWETNDLFNIILMDPPWRNKYIRRKKSQVASHSYTMLFDEELKDLPIKKLLAKNGLVVVWCTNSPNHLNAILNDFFPKWNIKFLTKYYWLKVTKSGQPVCQFSPPSGKQPFEQIVIGINVLSDQQFSLNKRIIVSIPSALHSHKPPLTEIFKEFIQENSKCLEIFARYLLPNWTSWGLEVCRFQHESLFVTCKS